MGGFSEGIVEGRGYLIFMRLWGIIFNEILWRRMPFWQKVLKDRELEMEDMAEKIPESKIWLASPTMHGEELKYMVEAYETNWRATVGANINEVERIAAESAQMKYAVGMS